MVEFFEESLLQHFLDSSSEEGWKPPCKESSNAVELSIFMHDPFVCSRWQFIASLHQTLVLYCKKFTSTHIFEFRKCFPWFSLASDAIEKQVLLFEGLLCPLWNWSNFQNMNLLLEACSAGLKDKAISYLLPSYGKGVPWWEYSTSHLSHL